MICRDDQFKANRVIPMKKGLLVGFFSLLVLAPFRCALAQAISKTTAVKAVEESSTGVGRADERQIRDPASEATGNSTARNQTTSPTLAESTEAVSKVSIKTSSEAERNYKAGVAFYESGKFNKALSAFTESNRLKPNDPQTQYMLGMVYWKTSAYEDALEYFKLSVQLKPNWAEAYFRLGQTYYVLGEKKETNEAYKKLLELNSPLANKLYGTNSFANPTNLAGGPKAEPADSIAKQAVVVPVSTPAVAGPLKQEKARATANESNRSSTPAASSNKTIRAVARPNEGSPAVSESNSSSTTARTANGDPAPGNKATSESNNSPTTAQRRTALSQLTTRP